MQKSICYFLILVSISGYAQISTPVKVVYNTTKVGRIAPLGSFVAELTFTGDVYTLRFNDMRYQTEMIKSVSFTNVDSTIDKLYGLFKESFKSNVAVTFKLGSQEVSISQSRFMGITSAMFKTVEGAYFTIVEKQVDKLFGH
jgi:hypothetical protein